jgi:hypothetical protein
MRFPTYPPDILSRADALLSEKYGTDIDPLLVEIACEAMMTQREFDAKLLEEGFDKPVAEAYRNDGQPSKNDTCPHGRYMYEDCEACAAKAIRGTK